MILNENVSISYSGDGATTTFAYNFPIQSNTWLKVYVNGVLQTLTTNYSVTGVNVISGGNVIFTSAPDSDTTILITRTNVPLTQLTDYIQGDSFPAESHELSLDKMVTAIQQINYNVGKSIRIPEYETNTMVLNAVSVRKNTVLGFDSNGNITYETMPEGSPVGTFIASGSGAVERTYQDKNRDFISVKDYIPTDVSPASENCSTYFQAAIDYATTIKAKVIIPAGTYLITESLSCPIGTQLEGETGYQYNRGFSQDPLATTILFQPDALSDLFVFDGTSYGGFRFHNSIKNLYIRGNSTNASGNSGYAFNLDGVIYANFENIGIDQFRYSFLCDGTINNRFSNVFCTGKSAAIQYAGNNETTDVWHHCTFFGSPIGVEFVETSIAIRFNHCLWEQIDTYGMEISKDCINIIVSEGYCEDVPFTNNSSYCMFRVGYSGTTLVTANHLIITGGYYAGRNAGIVGSFIAADYCNGIEISNCAIARFTNGIAASSNTTNDAIVITGFTALSVTNIVTDSTKVSGLYPAGVVNSGTHNRQNARVHNLTVVNNATLGNILGGTITPPSTYFAPSTDNDKSLGLLAQRWSVVYAGTGTINTSDERYKQQIQPINDLVLNAWGKVDYVAYKFNDAVETKGDGARWHFGLIAQRVKEAFESEGLNAFDYGILCYDEWEEQQEVKDENGNIIKDYRPSGNAFGIRYEEALALECAYLRSKLK